MSNARNNKRNYSNSTLVSEHGKVPPNAVELEDALLGAMMLESTALRDVSEILTADSFYKQEHKHIYAAIADLYANDCPVDILTVTEWLKKAGHLELVGGPYYISKLTDRVASSANAEYHARIIHQKFILREIIRVTGDIYHQAFDDQTDGLELLDEFSIQSERLAGLISRSKAGTIEDNMNLVIADVKRVQSGEMQGMSTGIANRDRVMNGRKRSELIVIAARPAMGKSAAALCEAIHMALQGRKIAFFSLEMSSKQLVERLMSIETSIYLDRFQSGEMDLGQMRGLEACKQKWAKLELYIIDDVMSLNGIRAEARRLHEKYGLDAVYIDYLQLVEHRLPGRNRENEVSEISRAFKKMAKDMNVPVIVLSQLSRSVETRGGNKRPILSDLRESGAIEQDADVVEFIFRPQYYGIKMSEETGLNTAGLAELIVAKNRSGQTATLPMRFEGNLTRFSDWIDGSIVTARPLPAPMHLSNGFPENEIDEVPF